MNLEDPFPIGAALGGGRWRVTEVLRGGPDRGQLRAVGESCVLVSIGSPQRGELAQAIEGLRWTSPGLTPLVGGERLAGEGASYDAILEVEPPGVSLEKWRGSAAAARRIALQLADVVQAASERGLVIAGLRPELVYVENARLSGVAPRAERFLGSASQPSYGVPPCFEEIYQSPEQLTLRPFGPASDVFSLAATLAFLFTGRPPFEGVNVLHRMSAAAQGQHGSLADAHELGPVLAAALSLQPEARPAIGALRAALATAS